VLSETPVGGLTILGIKSSEEENPWRNFSGDYGSYGQIAHAAYAPLIRGRRSIEMRD
jgi:hypothetical protein